MIDVELWHPLDHRGSIKSNISCFNQDLYGDLLRRLNLNLSQEFVTGHIYRFILDNIVLIVLMIWLFLVKPYFIYEARYFIFVCDVWMPDHLKMLDFKCKIISHSPQGTFYLPEKGRTTMCHQFCLIYRKKAKEHLQHRMYQSHNSKNTM